MYMPPVCVQGRVSDALELQAVVGAGNYTQILSKNSKCSQQLSHLFRPQLLLQLRKQKLRHLHVTSQPGAYILGDNISLLIP